jgi:hypothetical protein
MLRSADSYDGRPITTEADGLLSADAFRWHKGRWEMLDYCCPSQSGPRLRVLSPLLLPPPPPSPSPSPSNVKGTKMAFRKYDPCSAQTTSRPHLILIHLRMMMTMTALSPSPLPAR